MSCSHLLDAYLSTYNTPTLMTEKLWNGISGPSARQIMGNLHYCRPAPRIIDPSSGSCNE
jgi:hypothetical protein